MIDNRFASLFLALAFLVLMIPKDAVAQECSGDSNEIRMNYSLYYESFKNKDYPTALPYLKWILDCSPGFSGKETGDDRNFDRAVKLYQGLADAASGDMQRAYLDTALMYFDKAVPTLQEAGADIDAIEWTFNKGRFIQKNAEILDDIQGDVGALYRETYDNNAEMLNPLSYYVNVIIADYASKDEKAEAVEFMEDVESKFGADEETAAVIATWRERLFDDPEERMAFLEDQLDKNPGDVELIEELLEIYEELDERDKLQGMLTQMIDVAPTPKILISAGAMKLNDGDDAAAIELFNKALEMPGGDAVAKEANFNLGTAARQQGRLQQARTYYRRALAADPSFGRAVYEIASVYADAIRDCGGAKMEREDRAVYWLVADYLERARRVDSSLAGTVSNTLRSYKPYYPAAEDLFFKGWKEGQDYKIDYGCYAWINETTKVRKP